MANSSGPIVVPEKKRRVNFLWGFLAVAFAAALVRGHFGAETASGRLVVDVVFGGLLVGTVAAWMWSGRHPASLVISSEEIVYSHRGQPNATRLLRSSGDLFVYTTLIGGKSRLRFLRALGSEEAVPLQMFDWDEVEEACLEKGWRFAGTSG